MNYKRLITELISESPSKVDLTDLQQSHKIIEHANKLLDSTISVSDIEKEESHLINEMDEKLTFTLLILKIVKAKLKVLSISIPCKVSIVFAVYKEHNRILSKDEHPHGEDFLRRKVEQLEWLFDESPQISWELLVVDDGCPENSGKIAQDIIDKEGLGAQVKVLYLEDAIRQELPPVKTMKSTSESQKGGSVIYGMWKACQESVNEEHIIAYTDADLSTHLGQVGLLMHELISKDKLVAIGSRREPDSIVIKKGTRNDRGKLFIYLWKRLIPTIGSIIDTQCGFKAFKKEILEVILDDLIEMRFAFDIELLLKSELYKSSCIEKVAIAWIDSEEASTTTDLQPYLPMLKSIVQMYRKYLPSNPIAEEFSSFIEELNDESFFRLLSHIPEKITSREPIEFNSYSGISVSHLKA